MSQNFENWVGNTEEQSDLITAWPVAALHATFDLAAPALEPGDVLPPMWHWLYFLPTVRRSELGTDGHPNRGGFLPPVDLPRRMFAGGRTRILRPLRIGQHARRVGTIKSVAAKEGKSGRLTFVTAQYGIFTDEGLAIEEEQDLVYREAASRYTSPEPGAGPIPEGDWMQTVVPDPVMLFRFSALTFNSHRIHFDLPYTAEVEGYPDLVVHGPMTAMLLAGLCTQNDLRPIELFTFRARSPLFAGSPFTLVGSSRSGAAELSAWSHDAREAMTAEVTFRAE